MAAVRHLGFSKTSFLSICLGCRFPVTVYRIWCSTFCYFILVLWRMNCLRDLNLVGHLVARRAVLIRKAFSSCSYYVLACSTCLNMPYSDRLKRLDLDLESLQLRRLLHADLIMCYKIVFGLVDLHNMISSHLVLSHTHTRGTVTSSSRSVIVTLRSSFFCERVINVWNNLPTEVLFSSITAFKHSIRKVGFTNFLKR